jgi:xanthine dehydrogenase YagT iron-sulfur-binding subunit
VNRPPHDQRPPARKALSRSPLPSVIELASQISDGRQSVRQAAPFPASPAMADSGELVARALAILGEEADAWRARQPATRTFGVSGDPKAQSASGGNPAHTISIRLTVNGTSHVLSLDPRSSLLDVLRERLALTGAKKGCDHGQCGACTVHLDGRGVLSCLTPAVHADGRHVTTVEGLSPPAGDLHPVQQAFIDHDALQCGYCTPGQIMAAVACVNDGHATSPEQIREYMSGNLCRCGAYVGIVAAIRDAAPKMRKP